MRNILAFFLLTVALALGVAMLWFGARSRQVAAPPVVAKPTVMAAPVQTIPAPAPAATAEIR